MFHYTYEPYLRTDGTPRGAQFAHRTAVDRGSRVAHADEAVDASTAAFACKVVGLAWRCREWHWRVVEREQYRNRERCAGLRRAERL